VRIFWINIVHLASSEKVCDADAVVVVIILGLVRWFFEIGQIIYQGRCALLL